MTLASGFVNASMFCIPENEYVSVIWFVYQSTSLLEQELQNGSYVVERNGHNLMVQDVPLVDFLMTLFECRLLGSFSAMNFPIVNFTTVGIPGITQTHAAMNGLSLLIYNLLQFPLQSAQKSISEVEVWFLGFLNATLFLLQLHWLQILSCHAMELVVMVEFGGRAPSLAISASTRPHHITQYSMMVVWLL